MANSPHNTPFQQKNNTSRIPEQYSIVGNGNVEHCTIRAQVYDELDRDPLLTAKRLAKLCDLPYKQYRNYLTKLRSDWKQYHPKQRGSMCSNLHCYKGKLLLARGLSDGCRAVVLGALANICVGCVVRDCRHCVGFRGWVPSRARNKFLVFRGLLGRVTWFRTGTLLLHVKKPGNLGRAKQLFCDAFGSTELITDVKLLVGVTEGIVEKLGLKALGLYQKEVHAPFLTSQRLPQLEIRDFEESHGIVIKVGDRTHPNAVEVIAQFPAQTERLIEQTGRLVKQLESKETENIELKANLGKLMTVLNRALGESPSEPKPEELSKNLGVAPSYVS